MTFGECLKTLTVYDVEKTERFRAQARERLEAARRAIKAAKVYGRGDLGPAIQELACAMAVAEEWGVIGRNGGAR